MHAFQLSRMHWMLLAATALGSVLAASIGVPPAQAQFVCGGSLTGGEPQSGAGATVTVFSGSVACGPSADASGTSALNTAIGVAANASGDASRNTAIGNSANASGGVGALISSNTATGVGANASGTSSNNTATGVFANASGDSSSNTAIGNSANASGAGSFNTAVGNGSTATGLNSSAFGNGASATFANSAAFGNGATATRANQQVFGTATNTYTTPGIASAASLAAQTGPTSLVTSDAAGNLATGSAASLGLATTAQVSAINSQLNSLSSRIDDVNKEARRGIAATAAMAYAPTPSAPGRTTFAINGSVYQDTGGVGVAFQHRFAGTSIPLYFSGAYGNGGGREHVGRAGIGFEW